MHHSLAVIFDFDDTLVPDSTTQFLRSKGIDTGKFWGEQARDLIQRGYDPAMAFLRLFLENVGPGKPLGKLTNTELRAGLPSRPGARILRSWKNKHSRSDGISALHF